MSEDEKMVGCYSPSDGTLYLKAANLNEFHRLINQAEEQADQLRKTISQLMYFDLKFKFSDGENDSQEE